MTPRIVVVGLGPGDPTLVTAAVHDAIAEHASHQRWTRTDRHPAAVVLGEHRSFDEVYEHADELSEVYATIVDRLVAAAHTDRSVCYAVPGSPFVAEHTVQLLRGHESVRRGALELELHPALSFLDLAWARLGVDPFTAGVRIVDGHRFAVEAAGERGPLLVGQCDSLDVLSAIKLGVEEPAGATVTVLHHLGLHDETIRELAWEDLDRTVEPDHLTSLWIPSLAAPVAQELVRFEELVRVLRERCPWDSVQTHESLRPYLVEETYEVIDAINGFDPDAGTGVDALAEELGDLLFQVVIHATLAAEEGWFTLADVARGIHDKLHHRHPHVFGDVTVSGADEVVTNWDRIKAAEKGRTGPYEGIPAALPPRLFAEKLLRRAAKAGLLVDLSAELAALDTAEAHLRSRLAHIVEKGE